MARKTLSLPDDVISYLKSLDNASGYVTGLVRDDMNKTYKLTQDEIRILREFIRNGVVVSAPVHEVKATENKIGAINSEDSTVQAIAEGFIKRKSKRL